MLLLDTHVWFRASLGPHLLRPKAAAEIAEAELRDNVFISVVSIWELAMHERSGKLAFDGGVEQWTQQALARPGINLLPYTPRIAIESVYLPDPMHKDPVDRILIASARIEHLKIVTSDKAMLAFAKTSSLPSLRA